MAYLNAENINQYQVAIEGKSATVGKYSLSESEFLNLKLFELFPLSRKNFLKRAQKMRERERERFHEVNSRHVATRVNSVSAI